MIVITGAAGFIGSVLANSLAKDDKGIDLILVDDFSHSLKSKNTLKLTKALYIDRKDFIIWFSANFLKIDYVFHLGARTDTAEQNWDIFQKLNLEYSMGIWSLCTQHEIPLVYASSAATYGNGQNGFDDIENEINKLKPLNPYGVSKQKFDQWALRQKKSPPSWIGLKFFNVYGPNEYHKGRMASVIFHCYHQIQKTGKMKLFRSHKDEFLDGEQKRDFIYVKDLVDVMLFLFNDGILKSGIYNLGTGKARTFLDLVNAVFKSLELKSNIEFIDIPIDIRDAYQYFTEASMDKLKALGYKGSFTELEEGINDYVINHLKHEQ